MNLTYIITQSFKNLGRHRKRYVVCSLFLLCTVSVMACALYYYFGMINYTEQMREKYLSRVNFKFRKELQWLGDEYNYNGVEKYILKGKDVVFNSDGSMNKYNVPLYVTKEYFTNFAESTYVKESMLVYTENVYGAFNIETDDDSKLRDEMRNTNFMYGGSFYTFKFMFSGVTETDIKISLTEGQEHRADECLIYAETAEACGYKVGDYITYNDEIGNKIGRLKIAGLFNVTYGDEVNIPEFDSLHIYGTNPFFRNTHTYIRYMIITDFDTVYNLYRNNNPDGHEINKYLAWYVLDEYRNFDAFVAEYGQYEHSDTMGFYPDTTRYEKSIEVPLQIIDTAKWFVIITSALSCVVIFVMTLYMLRERNRETGILYALGATRRTLILLFAIETAIFILEVSIVSLGMGIVLAKLFEKSTPFIMNLNIKYSLTPPIILITTILAFVTVLISALITAIEIIKRSPSALISTNR